MSLRPARMLTGLAAAAIVILSAAAPAHSQMTSIVIKDAWVRPTPPGAPTTAMYAEIHNMGDTDDTLITASTDRAQVVEIHEVKQAGGMMQMRQIEGGLAIPAKGMVAIQPGGYHLMVIGLHTPVKKGETLTFELTFAKAGKVTVQAKAEMRLGGMQSMQHGKEMKHDESMKMKK